MNLKTMTTEELRNLKDIIQEQIALRDEKPKKPKLDEVVKCNICTGSYTYKHKSRHEKTDRHMVAKEHLDTLKRLARSKTLAGRVGDD
jgi:hypothetical protein